MPRRRAKRTGEQTQKPMDAPGFVREMARRQGHLLGKMSAAVKEGKLLLDQSSATDRYIEAVVSDWCTQSEPELESHLNMLGAVFLWALLDKTFGNDAANDNVSRTEFADIAVEALKTIQTIFGTR